MRGVDFPVQYPHFQKLMAKACSGARSRNINGSRWEPPFYRVAIPLFRLCHLCLQTDNLTIDFGHHRQMQLVLHLRDKDFALIKLKSANVLDIQTSTEQDLHVLRYLQRIVALENFHCCLLPGLRSCGATVSPRTGSANFSALKLQSRI